MTTTATDNLVGHARLCSSRRPSGILSWRVRFLGVALLLVCHSAFGAAAFVQDAVTVGTASSISSNTVSLTGTTAGNTLVVVTLFVSIGGGADFALCSDTINSSYGLYAQDSVNGAAVGICAAVNIAGGNVTATCRSQNGSHTFFSCYIAEYSGVYAVDTAASSQGTSGTSISYSTPTNLSGDMLIAAVNTSGNAGTFSNGSGWTSHATKQIQNQLATSAGSYTTNWTWTNNTTPVSAAITLKAGSNPTIGTSLAYRLSPLVQGQASNNGAGTCIYPRNVTSGDILIAHASVALGSTLNTPTDTLSTTWTLVDSSSTQAVTKLWIGTAGSSGADTITFGGTYSAIGDTCTELDSSLVSSTVDFHFTGSFEGTPNLQSTTSGTSTVNGDFLFLATGGNTGSGITWPISPLQWLAQSQGQMIADEVLGAAAPVTAAFNTQSFIAGNYILLALKPAASITIFTSALPSASSNAAYTASLTAAQGTGSYTWSISSGSLPTGLSINSATGVISGTIGSAATTQTFTVQVTDGTNTTTKSLTITVNGSVSTPSFVQGLLSQLGTSLSFTSVAVNDVIWVTAETHVSTVSGPMACPTDTLGTAFKFVGSVNVPLNSNSTLFSTWVCMGQATSSGADTVTVASGQYTPAGMQVRNVQPFGDTTTFTTGPTTGTSQTFTSTSATTPSPNTLSLGAAIVNPSGTATSFAAQSPYTDAGSLLGDGNFVDLGYNVFSTVSSAAFASAITGSTAGYGWNTVMSNLRSSTSGVVAGARGVPAVY